MTHRIFAGAAMALLLAHGAAAQGLRASPGTGLSRSAPLPAITLPTAEES